MIKNISFLLIVGLITASTQSMQRNLDALQAASLFLGGQMDTKAKSIAQQHIATPGFTSGQKLQLQQAGTALKSLIQARLSLAKKNSSTKQ